MLTLLVCLREDFEKLLPNRYWLPLMANHFPTLEKSVLGSHKMEELDTDVWSPNPNRLKLKHLLNPKPNCSLLAC